MDNNQEKLKDNNEVQQEELQAAEQKQKEEIAKIEKETRPAQPFNYLSLAPLFIGLILFVAFFAVWKQQPENAKPEIVPAALPAASPVAISPEASQNFSPVTLEAKVQSADQPQVVINSEIKKDEVNLGKTDQPLIADRGMLQDFEGAVYPAFNYGNLAAGKVIEEEGNNYFSFRYNNENTAELSVNPQNPHSGYRIKLESVAVKADSNLVFKYRSFGISDLRIGLELDNQRLQWFLNVLPNAEWKELSLPLGEKYTDKIDGVYTVAINLTTFAKVDAGQWFANLDLDDFKLVSSGNSSQKQDLEARLESREEAENKIEKYVRIRNLATDKGLYKRNEAMHISYDIVNISSERLKIPLNNQYSSPMYLLGTVQAWIEPLDDSAKQTDFGRAKQVGTRFAAGGSIFSAGQVNLEANETIRRNFDYKPKLMPGKYRYYIEFKNNKRDVQINEVSVEFEVSEPE